MNLKKIKKLRSKYEHPYVTEAIRAIEKPYSTYIQELSDRACIEHHTATIRMVCGVLCMSLTIVLGILWQSVPWGFYCLGVCLVFSTEPILSEADRYEAEAVNEALNFRTTPSKIKSAKTAKGEK